jgi:hypothetical protein
MAGGRPTKYDPGFIDSIVEFMGRGYSLTAYAGEIGVHRETLLNWGQEHPEFFDAIKRGKAARVKCLETTLLLGETGPKVTGHIFALKNADPDEWRDKHEYEHGGTGGGPIQLVTGVIRADDKA